MSVTGSLGLAGGFLLLGCGIGWLIGWLERRQRRLAKERADLAEQTWHAMRHLKAEVDITAHRTPRGWRVEARNDSDAATAMIVISAL